VAGLRSRRSGFVAAIVLVVVPAFIALTLRLFVNAPVRSDAIVVLGGNGAGPFDVGVTLAKERYAPAIVFSLVPAYSCEPSVLHLGSERILCFRADPQTTQGEARSIAQLAAVHHWHRIIVVMPTTRATRARLRIGRCYPGQMLEVAAPPAGFWAWCAGSSTSGPPW